MLNNFKNRIMKYIEPYQEPQSPVWETDCLFSNDREDVLHELRDIFYNCELLDFNMGYDDTYEIEVSIDVEVGLLSTAVQVAEQIVDFQEYKIIEDSVFFTFTDK